jgi:histidinol-phosphate aminotransferase
MPIAFKSYLNTPSKYKGGKAKQQGEVIKLSSNENMNGTSPLALEAIRDNYHLINEYPERTDQSLREALSDYYGDLLNADQFFTSNGGVRAIDMILQGFLDIGTEVIFSNPGFGPYRAFPTKYGAKAVDVPLIGDNFDLDIEGMLSNISTSTRLLFITSPNNPTGTCPKKEDLDYLMSNIPDHVVVVYDEVYFQYADSPDYVRAYDYVVKGLPIIGINSFSKAYGMAGMRVGYCYSTPEIASYLRNIPTPFPINLLSTKAAMAALTDDAFIELSVYENRKGKAYLYEELTKLNIKYWETQANFILLNPDMEATTLANRLLAKNIMVRPVKNFGFDGIRLTIGKMSQNELVVKALKDILGRQ